MAEEDQDQLCPDCGARFGRRHKHRSWHREQDRQARSLERRIDVLDSLVLKLGGVDPAQLVANQQLERQQRRLQIRTDVNRAEALVDERAGRSIA